MASINFIIIEKPSAKPLFSRPDRGFHFLHKFTFYCVYSNSNAPVYSW